MQIFPRVSGGLCHLLYLVLPYTGTDVPLDLTPLRKNNYIFDHGSAEYLESQSLFQVDISELDYYYVVSKTISYSMHCGSCIQNTWKRKSTNLSVLLLYRIAVSPSGSDCN